MNMIASLGGENPTAPKVFVSNVCINRTTAGLG